MKARIDRSECTSCGTCWETCPEYFEENPGDHFSQVIEKFRVNGDSAQGTVPENLEDCVKEAADMCPVQIISIGES